MKTTLLIMAAGIGSRFGEGIKQLEPVDNNNHIIMDYSIHDAIEAGFNEVVFIIRKDIEEEFKKVMALVDPEKVEDIKAKVTEEYLKAFPKLEGRYSAYVCESADGVRI